MANIPPIQPPETQSCFSPPSKKTFQNLTFAVALIVALGSVLVGVLGLYKIDIFAGIGTHVSQGLAFGGGALTATSIIAYIITCACRETPEEPPVPVQVPGSNPNQQPPNSPPEIPLEPSTRPDALAPQPEAVDPAPIPKLESCIESPAQPSLTWQPLIDLKNSRAQSCLCLPPKQCAVLEHVQASFPASTRPLMPQQQFVKKMQELYCNLLKGKCKLVIDNQEKTFTRKGAPPLDIISQAQAFVSAQIEAYNTLLPANKPKIQCEDFFQGCTNAEQDLQPEAIRKLHKMAFESSLTSELGILFEGEDDGGLELRHLNDIKNYIKQQVDQFNKYNEEKIDPEDIHKRFTYLEGQLNLWKQMQVITCFSDKIDRKILALTKFNDALPEPDDCAWAHFPLFKTLMNKDFVLMHTGFFSDHQFFVGKIGAKEEDLVRKAQVESLMREIARKLGTIAPDIDVELDTSKDADQARREQEVWNVQEAQRLTDETILNLSLAGEI